MNQFGQHFRLAIWGESHGPQVGITIDGVPQSIELSEADFEADLARRRSGAPGTTPRREEDRPQIVSGLYEGCTTGAPLTIVFANNDTRPQDYAGLETHFRPSHADLIARRKFGGFNDPRGGGHRAGPPASCPQRRACPLCRPCACAFPCRRCPVRRLAAHDPRGYCP